MAPTLSIALCTLERSGPLADAVADVVSQAPPDAQILVVEQSAGEHLEATRALVARLDDPRVTLVEASPAGLPAARNLALEHCTGEIVLFLDDDVRLSPGCIDAHLAEYAHPGTGGVVGRIIERSVRPNAPSTVNELTRGGRVRTNLSGHARVRVGTLKGANMSFRRAALDAAGPFDPGYLGTALLEDADMSVRVASAGWELWFAPEAELTHLSAPRGGVRQGAVESTERWRFHNTAYFVHKHQPQDRSRARATFVAIAARRALQWRDPRAAARLMVAFDQGWSSYSR